MSSQIQSSNFHTKTPLSFAEREKTFFLETETDAFDVAEKTAKFLAKHASTVVALAFFGVETVSLVGMPIIGVYLPTISGLAPIAQAITSFTSSKFFQSVLQPIVNTFAIGFLGKKLLNASKDFDKEKEKKKNELQKIMKKTQETRRRTHRRRRAISLGM